MTIDDIRQAQWGNYCDRGAWPKEVYVGFELYHDVLQNAKPEELMITPDGERLRGMLLIPTRKIGLHDFSFDNPPEAL